MNSYSLEFLDDDWDGSGYDFGFACVFDHELINQQSVSKFIASVAETVKQISLKHISSDCPNKWQMIPEIQAESFLMESFTWDVMQLLVLNITTEHSFSGYIELNQPDQVIVGGASENYYKGNWDDDLAVAQDITNLVRLATKRFGDGHGVFGAGSSAMQDANKLRERGEHPNLTIKTDYRLISMEIAKTFAELRNL